MLRLSNRYQSKEQPQRASNCSQYQGVFAGSLVAVKWRWANSTNMSANVGSAWARSWSHKIHFFHSMEMLEEYRKATARIAIKRGRAMRNLVKILLISIKVALLGPMASELDHDSA